MNDSPDLETIMSKINAATMHMFMIDLGMYLYPHEYEEWSAIAANPTMENIQKVQEECSKRSAAFLERFKIGLESKKNA